MPTDAEWMAILTVARLVQPAAPSAPNNVKGRFIAFLAGRLCTFWGKHRTTLIPVMSQLAIAALDALLQALPAILAVDPPGPN